MDKPPDLLQSPVRLVFEAHNNANLEYTLDLGRRDLGQMNRCTLCDIEIFHAFTVRLWLTQPPSDITHQLKVFYNGLHVRNSRSSPWRFVPVLGGVAKISQMTALQFKRSHCRTIVWSFSKLAWYSVKSATWVPGSSKEFDGPTLFILLSDEFLMSISHAVRIGLGLIEAVDFPSAYCCMSC